MKSLHLNKPHLLVVIGIPGAGKSFFAEKFADTFSIPYLSYEALQVASGMTLNDKDTGEVAGVMFQELVKTKQTLILEGPGTTRTDRISLAQLARQSGYVPLFIWVQTDTATAEKRTLKNKQSGVNLSEEEFAGAVKRFTPLHASEKSIVISGKHTYASQAKIVLKRLIEPSLETRRAPVQPAPSRPASNRIHIN